MLIIFSDKLSLLMIHLFFLTLSRWTDALTAHNFNSPDMIRYSCLIFIDLLDMIHFIAMILIIPCDTLHSRNVTRGHWYATYPCYLLAIMTHLSILMLISFFWYASCPCYLLTIMTHSSSSMLILFSDTLHRKTAYCWLWLTKVHQCWFQPLIL